MVRYISLLLAGTSCALALTAGVADSRAQSSPQMYTNAYVKQLTAGVADPKPDSLASFTFDGLTIGSTTLDEFKAKYRPGNRQGIYVGSYDGESDTTNGVESFTAVGVPNCDGISCKFLDGTLYEIRIHYNADRVNKMGGLDSIVGKISSRFGLSPEVAVITTVEDEQISTYTWESPENNRRAQLPVLPTVAILYVVDTKAESILSERSATNANLGF